MGVGTFAGGTVRWQSVPGANKLTQGVVARISQWSERGPEVSGELCWT
jgi:hypothetical protein